MRPGFLVPSTTDKEHYVSSTKITWPFPEIDPVILTVFFLPWSWRTRTRTENEQASGETRTEFQRCIGNTWKIALHPSWMSVLVMVTTIINYFGGEIIRSVMFFFKWCFGVWSGTAVWALPTPWRWTTHIWREIRTSFRHFTSLMVIGNERATYH